MNKPRYRNVALSIGAAAAVVVLSAACSSTSPAQSSAGGMGDMGGMHGSDSHAGSTSSTGDATPDTATGRPGDPSQATRTIKIATGNELRFTPDTINVKAGETVTFEISDTGSLPHEFTLGTAEMQSTHAAQMAQMSGMAMHDDPGVVSLNPGETKTLTWTFTSPGTVLYGCHVPGHWEGGMKGTITVT